MNERIYMSSPDVGELEEEAVLAAMRSGWIAPLGPDVDAFEAKLALRIGVAHGVALSSGTSALHLGLLTLGAKPGDVVVTSTMTFAATTNAIMYTGAEPYFIDCLPETGNMDPELLRRGLIRLAEEGRRVAAILPVDLLGKAADYTNILAIADEFEVPVLSDAAESLGATHKGTAAGSFGAASVFSFNGNKIMTTSGGGMLMTDDAEFADHVRYLATQARQPVVHYEHADVGYNYRMSNLLAALGRAQLSRLDEMIAKRRTVRNLYKELFSRIDGVEVFGVEGDEEDNVWLTAISIDESVTGFSPDKFASALARQNIESRPIWKPMHLQPVFSRFQGEISGVAEQLFRTNLTLPSGSALKPTQREFVLDKISAFIGGRK
ncbi:aminotransferase class I/II-fold pyridoxal phosphate-dependent enzyme [Paeniglutamicibacter sp. ZC-3]|uniref:DegT/DnrJ/EryC1/StrS family aminotransferase n=1 Tax=Paeniglutamicibacter sp. ZC-3 TaxID=2986919 RepID=UPI0021F76B8D|nr:aminotransferase class I/II-fold pyridoxal phosphate-dependent enzyme [Paeniglutamicibacter sp. ZC-3]MCV9996516.1 aminotransferase class I/II-fold pyridoxal phosphate-dependent enzyme [Paeniglutamicibacter sp. ZC-3]